MSNVLYPEDAVFLMLLAAYRAGFEGPLELAEDNCREIITKGTYKESDLEIIEFMQRREQKKKYDEGLEARKTASRRSADIPAAAVNNAAPDYFDEQEQLDV